MPSFLVMNRSGGDPLIASGNPFSGRFVPTGGIQLVWDATASGFLYMSLSGNMTVQSGSLFGGGSGSMMDGMQIARGGAFFLPKQAAPLFSGPGPFGPYFACDLAASGQGRLYFEAY